MVVKIMTIWLFAELSQSPVQNPALQPGQPGQPKIQVKGCALGDDHDYSWPGPDGAAGAPEILERNAMMYLCLKLQFAAVVINCAAPLQLENQMGFRDLEIEGRAGPGGDSDFMAGGGNRPGPAPDVRHQPPGDAHQ